MISQDVLESALDYCGNQKVTKHFIEKLFDRGIDKKQEVVKKWIQKNQDTCLKMFNAELNGLHQVTQKQKIADITFVYYVDIERKKVVWKTVYFKGAI